MNTHTGVLCGIRKERKSCVVLFQGDWVNEGRYNNQQWILRGGKIVVLAAGTERVVSRFEMFWKCQVGRGNLSPLLFFDHFNVFTKIHVKNHSVKCQVMMGNIENLSLKSLYLKVRKHGFSLQEKETCGTCEKSMKGKKRFVHFQTKWISGLRKSRLEVVRPTNCILVVARFGGTERWIISPCCAA